MAKKKSRTTKPSAKSPSEVTKCINETLCGLVTPHNLFCVSGVALDTLETAHQVLELCDIIECRGVGYLDAEDLCRRFEFALGSIRESAMEAVKYAAVLCDREDNLRGALDRGAMAG